MDPSRADRIAGGLWGLLVGDALGVPYEFHAPDSIPARDAIEMTPPSGFRRAHERVPPGTWSDDGAQALALLASLLDCGRFDADDFARRLLAWYRDGAYAVDEHVFDVGVQTAQALRALHAGTPPLEAGPSHEHANGNGSLMRVLPLALWHRGGDDELVRDAHAQSLVTHGHARARTCCAVYCLWARRTLDGAEDPWAEAVATLRALHASGSAEEEALEWHVRPEEAPLGTGSGYVVDSLRSARAVLSETTFEDVVRSAIALGNDTDTTACIAGGIAGVRDGIGAIPKRWLGAMRGRDIVEPLLERLLSRDAS